MPPSAERAGHILLADSTIFTTLFGVSQSLQNFWRNLALVRQSTGGGMRGPRAADGALRRHL
jgi:hypothetical protein